MTYADAVASVRANVFPEREARNLRTVNSSIILDGIIDLMRWVPRIRRRQFTLTAFASTMYKCGCTYIDRPENGKVLRVYTYTQDNHCDAVYYTPVDRVQFDIEVKRRWVCGSEMPNPDLDDGVEGSDQTIGFVMASAGNNKGWRAANGIYTIVDDQIILFPHIEDTENVSVEWRGARKSFEDDDIVTWDRDILHAMELWTRSKVALRHTCDEKDYVAFRREYEGLRADIIIEDKTNERVDEDEVPYECCSPYQLITSDESDDGDNPDEETTYRFGLQVFDTLTEMRATTVSTDEITILSDFNGDHAKFYRDEDSTDADDGVNTVIDASGVHFTRLTL